MSLGILALQGALQPHRQKLTALGVDVVFVRTAGEISACDGLILPGGESSTLLNLIDHYRLRDPIVAFAASRPVWGVCAGAILMAERVENPSQESLGLIPMTVRRNAYGRQNESFIAPVNFRDAGSAKTEREAVFIRAPSIIRFASSVQVLADHHGDPVALRYGSHLVTTYHPELSASDEFHALFVSLCREAVTNPASGGGRPDEVMATPN